MKEILLKRWEKKMVVIELKYAPSMEQAYHLYLGMPAYGITTMVPFDTKEDAEETFSAAIKGAEEVLKRREKR